MNLVDLEALVWLVKAGSLSAAAEASGLPRTSLRRRVERLAEDVGEPLVELGPRGVTVTRAGALLARRAPRLIALRGALLDEARRVAREPVGVLRVVIGAGFPPPFIARLTAEILPLAPELHLHLVTDPRPLDRLDEGFDLVVHWGEPPAPRDGYSRVVWRAPMRLMASPAYLARRGAPCSLAALAGHELLASTRSPDRWPLLAGGALPIRPAHTVDDLYLLGCMAGAGMGIALIPLGGVETDPSVEALVPVLDGLVGEEALVRVFLPTRASEGGPAHTVIQRILAFWAAADP